MEFNVAQLMKEPIGARRHFELDDDIRGLDSSLTPRNNLTGKLQLLRIHSGILATGRFQVMLQLECGHCLEPVDLPVAVAFEESFRPLTDIGTGRFLPPDAFEGQEDDLTDEALLIDDQHILNIAEVLRQSIWLSIPLAVGCRYADQAECPHFQSIKAELMEMDVTVDRDSQTGSKTHANSKNDVEIDPRWQALLALQDDGSDD